MDHAIRCSSWADCVQHDGERVAIDGVYTLHRPMAGMKGASEIVRVRIIPDGGKRGAYLAPYWHADHVRPDAEMEALEGRRVTAVGTLHLTPPSPPAGDHLATMGGACLHPVESVTAAPESVAADPE